MFLQNFQIVNRVSRKRRHTDEADNNVYMGSYKPEYHPHCWYDPPGSTDADSDDSDVMPPIEIGDNSMTQQHWNDEPCERWRVKQQHAQWRKEQFEYNEHLRETGELARIAESLEKFYASNRSCDSSSSSTSYDADDEDVD